METHNNCNKGYRGSVDLLYISIPPQIYLQISIYPVIFTLKVATAMSVYFHLHFQMVFTINLALKQQDCYQPHDADI